VLGSLLENAIKYSPAGGTIEVRLRPRRDSSVVVEVVDRGIGIPLSEHERIFEKFHRLDPIKFVVSAEPDSASTSHASL
jgi:signal transduction histidine kinase